MHEILNFMIHRSNTYRRATNSKFASNIQEKVSIQGLNFKRRILGSREENKSMYKE